MGKGGWKYAVAAVLAFANTTCDDYSLLDLCDPRSGGSRVGFYSTGDCVGLDSAVFLGHEWLTSLANQDLSALAESNARFFTDTQIHDVIEGNRHTDYPIEMLVHLDNGVTAYLEALLAYHERPENQAPHFILRADNYTWEARREALCVIKEKTIAGLSRWPDEMQAALTVIGSATHTLQDSYAIAHAVRCDPEDPRDPDDPDNPDYVCPSAWCLVQLKAFVERPPPYNDANQDPDAPDYGLDIQYHERHDYETDPGHAVAGDAIFKDTAECHEPTDEADAEDCLLENAKAAVEGTRAYLAVVRELADSGADVDEIDDRLEQYFAEHMQLCKPPPWDEDPCPTAR